MNVTRRNHKASLKRESVRTVVLGWGCDEVQTYRQAETLLHLKSHHNRFHTPSNLRFNCYHAKTEIYRS
jgi:hypothetical protein